MTSTAPPELRSSLSRQTSGPPPAAADRNLATDPGGLVGTAVEPAFSIRIAGAAGAPCALCGTATGSGPVGYHGDVPICDLCLLDGSSALGMVLALVAVVRAFGSVKVASAAKERGALEELGSFARIYERFAAKTGPARLILPRLFVH